MKASAIPKTAALIGSLVAGLVLMGTAIVLKTGANMATEPAKPRFTIYLADPEPEQIGGRFRGSPFSSNVARSKITENEIDEYIWASQTIVLKSDVALTWPKVTQVGPDPEWARFAIGIDERLICYGAVMGITSVVVHAPVMYIYPSGAEEVFPPTNRIWTGIHLTWARDSGTMMTSAADERLFPCGTAGDAEEVKQLFSALGKLK